MLAHVATYTIVDLRPRRVLVEVDVRRGLPAFSIVGLGDRAVREARERVHAAILNSGLRFPDRRVTVNLAPAPLRKSGAGFDLAIACGILAASGELPREPLDRTAVYGELSLGGELRSTRGALAVAEGSDADGLEALVVPWELVAEASLVDGLQVYGAATLMDVVQTLRGTPPPSAPAAVALVPPVPASFPALDLADVRGHGTVLDAATVAAAGGHNLLLVGPPGTGKTMIARRLPTILPPLTPLEALEVTRIYSAVGLPRPPGLMTERPFRAPHHTISAAGLVGGGTPPRPGEVTLAHGGVLFLDELSEFARPALEALRQPLEDGRVAIVRGQRTAIFPSQAMLVAATNPCPCGMHPDRRCRCSDADHARHARKLSGPLLDRIDITARVDRPSSEDLAGNPCTSSEETRALVLEARERQQRRYAGTGIHANAQLDAGYARTHLDLTDAGAEAVRRAYDEGQLSARGRLRVLRIARTLADLDGVDGVSGAHIRKAQGLHAAHEAEVKAS